MEADWSVEIGAGLPTIVVPWDGFVDLRRDPFLASGLQETAASPALAQSLTQLNQRASPVFTSKCDLWLLSGEEIDPLEFDAQREDAIHGIASYIDVVAHNACLFTSFTDHEAWVRAVTDEMHRANLRKTRAELVVRPASVDGREGFAVTLYVASCGATADAARSILDAALEIAATITMKQAASTGE